MKGKMCGCKYGREPFAESFLVQRPCINSQIYNLIYILKQSIQHSSALLQTTNLRYLSEDGIPRSVRRIHGDGQEELE